MRHNQNSLGPAVLHFKLGFDNAKAFPVTAVFYHVDDTILALQTLFLVYRADLCTSWCFLCRSAHGIPLTHHPILLAAENRAFSSIRGSLYLTLSTLESISLIRAE